MKEGTAMQKNVSLGTLLIGIGVILMLAQFGLLGDHLILYLISLGFFTAYKYAGGSQKYSNVGFLIPATVLLAIALFVDVERILNNWLLGAGWFFLLLGGAFFAVYYFHTGRVGAEWGDKRWPLFPAAALTGFALFIAVIEQVDAWKRLGVANYILPILLIGIGLLLIFRKQKQS